MLDSPFAREAFETGEREAPVGANLSSPFARAFESPQVGLPHDDVGPASELEHCPACARHNDSESDDEDEGDDGGAGRADRREDEDEPGARVPANEERGACSFEGPYIGQAELVEAARPLEEFEGPPKGLVLLDHWHVPKTAASGTAGGFSTGSLAIMTPAAMNPGFIDAHDELVTDSASSGLQTCLQKLVPAQFSRLLAASAQTRPAARDRVCVTLVDLTGAKLAHPDFAGWGSTSARYGGSSPKMLAVYAAFQLRRDLRHLADDQHLTTGVALKKAALKAWQARKLWRGLPDLDWLFDFGHWSGTPGDLDFTAAVRTIFGHIDGNAEASRLIRRVGFPYIASVAWQSGLRHPLRGGMWLSHAYDGGDAWAGPAMKAPAYIHNLTALSAATFYTLLAQGRLVDDAASAEIQAVLAGGCRTCLWPSTIHLDASKCGIYKPYMHDCVLASDSGVTYAAGILTELDAEWPGWPRAPRCPTGDETVLYGDLCRALFQLIKNNNKSPKPTC